MASVGRCKLLVSGCENGVAVGPYPSTAPADVRMTMANTHTPSDVMSFAGWGRTKIEFGKTTVGLSYYQVAYGIEERFYWYRKWARVHLERKSILGRDFVKYLAVKERYFGVHEDELYLQSQSQAQPPVIPRTQHVRKYVEMDDPWNEGTGQCDLATLLLGGSSQLVSG